MERVFPYDDGRFNLVVVLGKQRASWGYLALIWASFSLILYSELKSGHL